MTSTGLCEGDLLKKCVSNEVVVVDCAAAGKVCSFVASNGVYDCVQECLPNCAGKECDSDGCGGQCGVCGKEQQCVSGLCEDAACVSDCIGKECGDDGCGGACGTCTGAETCVAGACDGGGTECPAGQVFNGTECVDDSGINADVVGGDTGGSSTSESSGSGCAVRATAPASNGSFLLLLLALFGLFAATRLSSSET